MSACVYVYLCLTVRLSCQDGVNASLVVRLSWNDGLNGVTTGRLAWLDDVNIITIIRRDLGDAREVRARQGPGSTRRGHAGGLQSFRRLVRLLAPRLLLCR